MTRSPQTVTVVTKPSMERNRSLGRLISFLEERGLQLNTAGPKIQLSLPELKDTYSLMGVDFCEEEERSWEIGSGYSFVFSFTSEDAHSVIDSLSPHKYFPVIYVKKR